MAILCLMRYEDWTVHEAEVRLAEHRELRQALGLASLPPEIGASGSVNGNRKQSFAEPD